MLRYRVLALWMFVLPLVLVLVPARTVVRAATDQNGPVMIETWGSYLMGDKDSKQDAKLLALYDAKRQALERAGTELTATTKVQNGELASDEVLSRAVGRIQAEILEEKWEAVGESLRVRLKVRSTIRLSDLQPVQASFAGDSGGDRVWGTASLPQPTGTPKALAPAVVITPWIQAQPRQLPSGQSSVSPGDAVSRGYALVGEGKSAQALELSDQILARYPGFAENYLLRARIFRQENRIRPMLEALHTGCQLGSEWACQMEALALRNQSGVGRSEDGPGGRRMPAAFGRRP